MDPNDDRHLFELLTELEQGSTGARAGQHHLNDMLPDYYDDDYYYDDEMDNAFYNALVEHEAEPEEEQFICYVPGCYRLLRPFDRLKGLREHIRTCHTPEEYQVYYVQRQARIRERRRQQKQQQQLECPHPGCNRVFRGYFSRRNLERHIEEVHDVQIFPCPYEGCIRTFRSERTRREHIRLVHENVREFCQVPGCGREFSNRKNLQQHMKKMHPGQEYDEYYHYRQQR